MIPSIIFCGTYFIILKDTMRLGLIVLLVSPKEGGGGGGGRPTRQHALFTQHCNEFAIHMCTSTMNITLI